MRKYAYDKTCDISLRDEFDLGQHKNHLLFFTPNEVTFVPCIVETCQAVIKVNSAPMGTLQGRKHFAIKRHIVRYHNHVYRDPDYYWAAMQTMMGEAKRQVTILSV